MHKKNLKKAMGISLVICLAAASLLTGCGENSTEPGSSVEESESTGTQADYSDLTTPGVNVNLVGDYSDKAIKAEWDEASATKIVFSGNTAEISGSGASVSDGVVTITEGGTYVLTGTGTEVQVVADVNEEDNIQLVLNGVTLENSTTAPINIVNGKNVFLTLADGSENVVRDTRAAYVEPEEGEEAAAEDGEDPIESAIYSEIDLTLNGNGSLTVEAGYDDGIRTKDDMEIISGTYHVTSSDDAFVGKDSISIRDGNITTVAKGTALKSNKSDDLEKGYIVVDGGTFDLIAAEGDGFHAEYALVINDCNVLIRECEEGLEAMNIVINGGNIELTSTDDGVNISEAEEYAALFGSAGTAAKEPENMGTTMEGENTSVDHIEGALIINGGYLHVTAQGDGLDSNGDILIAGGTTIVCGPTNSGNGTLDYADTFDMTGGVLALSGNQGMEQNITSETIPVATMHFSERQAAGTEVAITDAGGKELLRFTAKQEFSYVAFASAELTADSTYTATAGDNAVEGTASINQSMGMGGMMMPGGGRNPGQMPEDFDPSQLPEDFDPSQMPEGQMERGERPELPNGEAPTMPDGEVPTMPNGEVPTMPNGEMNETSGGTV